MEEQTPRTNFIPFPRSPALPPTWPLGPGDAGSSLRRATCPQNRVPYSWASWLVHRQGYRWVLRGRGNGDRVGNRRVLASSEPSTTSGDRQPRVLLWRSNFTAKTLQDRKDQHSPTDERKTYDQEHFTQQGFHSELKERESV